MAWGDRATFTAFVKGELEKWTRVVRTVGLKAEYEAPSAWPIACKRGSPSRRGATQR